jgi:glutaredoxin-related protein
MEHTIQSDGKFEITTTRYIPVTVLTCKKRAKLPNPDSESAGTAAAGLRRAVISLPHQLESCQQANTRYLSQAVLFNMQPVIRNIATRSSFRLRSVARTFSSDSNQSEIPIYTRHDPPGASTDVVDRIRRDLSAHKVFIYMKGTPSAPSCGYSNQVVKIMRNEGVEFGYRNVMAEEDVRQGIKEFRFVRMFVQSFLCVYFSSS